MQTYQYTAISRTGENVTGVVEAVDEYAAVTKIRESCITITKIRPVKAQAKSADLFPPHIKDKDLAMMCSQFSIILGAGLPVVRTVELIGEQTESKVLKQLLRETAADVSSGISLARSFERHDGLLPVAFIESVRAGEESGTLDSAFRRLSQYYNKAARTKGKVRAAMTYPIFTIIVAVVVVAVLMVKAVPTFIKSFQEMGIELPLPTRILIAVSNFFVKYWVFLLMGIMAAILLWKLWGHTAKGAVRQSEIRLCMPIMGKLHLQRVSAQLAGTLSTLLTAGVPLVRAVDNVAQVVDNALISKALDAQQPKLEEGKTLASCLKNCPYLPDLLIEMAGIGEETGTLEHTLEVVGDYYDNEAELAAQRVLALLEPVVICILAIIVVLILLSVYLPMFSLYSAF